jgi:hypothetical protein
MPRNLFSRHRPLQVAVGRAIDLAHAAGADGGEDLIGPRREPGTRAKGDAIIPAAGPSRGRDYSWVTP